jgi:quercetin dioxygenase-like cupin family protein
MHPAAGRLRKPGMSAESPTPEQARMARRIRQRLLERVADSDHSHLTVQPDAGLWQPFADGVQIKVLHERDGILSYLLRLAPGATLPAHRHPMDEECVVLQGTLRVGTHTEVGAGGWHLAHQGALHASLSTATGATVFLRGALPEARHLLT